MADYLLSFASIVDGVARFGSLRHIDLKDLSVLDELVASTDRADVLEYFASSLALPAGLFHLHSHRSHLNILHHVASTATLRASLLVTAFSSSAVTGGAVPISINFHAFLGAIVKLKQRHSNLYFALRATVTSSLGLLLL